MTPHNFPYEVLRSASLLAKDGNGNAAPLDVRGSFQLMGLEVATSSDTRYLPVPIKSGLRVGLTVLNLAAGGSIKVSLGSSTSTAPATTVDGVNKYATLNGYGQLVQLISVPATAYGATHQWILDGAPQGASLSAT